MSMKIDESIKGKTIMVVDDNRDMVHLFKRILTNRGYQVISAEDGLEALQMVEETPPDLILLDLSLPKMDGYKVCQRLKDSDTTTMIPVIMVTCRGGMTDKIQGLATGADDYITKPVNNEELLARVESLLKIRDLHERLTEARKLETLAQVAVSVNHEINNPLCSIVANAEMLKECLAGAHESVMHKIESILKESERIKQVINKLSNATKVISRDYIPGIKMIDLDGSSDADKMDSTL